MLCKTKPAITGINTGGAQVMTDEASNSNPRKVNLYEERGETSRYIDAEITKDGDLVVSGQDIGKLPQEFWGDSDYEFWVYVPARYKDDVRTALLEKLRAHDPKAVDEFKAFKSNDEAILALIAKLYAGNPKAVDQLKDFLRSRGIHVEFDSWA